MRKLIGEMVVVAVVSLILVGAGLGVRTAYREYVMHRFDAEVCDYNRVTERKTAFAQFALAEPLLSNWEREEFRRRLQVEASEDDRRYPLAIASLFDPESFDRKCVDGFDQISTDLMQKFSDRETLPSAEIFALWDAQTEVGHYSWYYAVEGFNNTDGSVCEVTYDEYVKWQPEFREKKKKLEALLASYSK